MIPNNLVIHICLPSNVYEIHPEEAGDLSKFKMAPKAAKTVLRVRRWWWVAEEREEESAERRKEHDRFLNRCIFVSIYDTVFNTIQLCYFCWSNDMQINVILQKSFITSSIIWLS